jgi:hypothetical protein
MHEPTSQSNANVTENMKNFPARLKNENSSNKETIETKVAETIKNENELKLEAVSNAIIDKIELAAIIKELLDEHVDSNINLNENENVFKETSNEMDKKEIADNDLKNLDESLKIIKSNSDFLSELMAKINELKEEDSNDNAINDTDVADNMNHKEIDLHESKILKIGLLSF